ncbi:hypothetical protein B2J88_17500 [Rhodococcus sp. SRB_17]|nr:hypothetical protein [Rhodococcus sp. SRB_17]
MRASTGVVRLLVAGILVWTVAGCGSAVEGAAEPASGQEGLFNPCTDIPDSVIEGVGLDPTTAASGIAGVEQPGWKICAWDGSWYYLTIFSTTYTVADIRENSEYVDFVDEPIGNRVAMQYRRASDSLREGCYLVFPADQGSIWINVEKILSRVQEEQSCVVARRAANQLESALPR